MRTAFDSGKFVAKAMIQAGMKPGTAFLLKRFVDSLQDSNSQQRLWLHEKGVHSKKVTVPTWEAVLTALNAARNAEHQKEQSKRARTPASPFKPRKSARQRQTKKK